MDIEKIVNEKFSEIVSSGKIEKMILDVLEKSIKSIIDECLRAYGDFGDVIKKKIKESLKIGDMDLDFPSYNQLVCNWITEIVNKQIITTGKEQIQENIKKFFVPLEKSEYKISEIVEKFKKNIFKKNIFDESDGEQEITFIEQRSDYGYVHFYLGEKKKKEKYQCEIKIDIDKDGYIYNARIDGIDADKIKLKPLYGFDSFIFQLFAAKIKIINDSEYVDITYCPYED